MNLTVLTSPDEVCVAAAALLLVLVEAIHGDPVWVCFTAGGALDAEHVFEGRVFGVEGTEICYAGGVSEVLEGKSGREVPIHLRGEGESENHLGVPVFGVVRVVWW